MFDLEQYIDMFLDESKDHLESLNKNLLELENDPENMEIVNEIFRIAHTLKGMSSTMGFTKMATLTHRMENVLDEVRSHKLNINSSIIDILFEGLDILEQFIKSIESQGKESDLEIDDIIRRLENRGKEEEKKQHESEQLKNEKTESDEYIKNIIDMAKENNMNVYDINVEIDSNCMLKSARAFLVFKAVEEIGDVVKSNPSVEDIEDENFENGFSMLVITAKDKEEVSREITSISEITSVKIEDVEHSQPVEIQEDEKEKVDDLNQEIIQAKEKQKSNQEIIHDTKNETKKHLHVEKESDTKVKKGKAGKTVRVDIDRLDNLMNLVSELIIVKTRLEDIDISTKNQNMNEAIEYLERITTSLHDAVTKVRMVPIERVFNRFPRMVRDLSKDLNKEIDLIMKGEETEVDRTVIDEIGDPLIHLLRNSIDHGIETPEIRKSLNKNEVGTVKLLAYPDGNNVVIEVCDDGAGLNIEKIKQKAIEKNIISQEQALNMDDKEAAHLIFAPGFSTADKVSNISGRGVGLDVVKTKIEALGGIVEIETEISKGSKFIIRLPLTLAIIQALLVIADDEKYAIPLNNIKEITNIQKSKVRIVDKKEIVLYRGNTLPLISLGKVLDCKGDTLDDSDEITVVIVKKGDKDLGIIVNDLIGQQEIVIKSLGKYLSGINFIAGATILGNGSVALIIDTNSLF